MIMKKMYIKPVMEVYEIKPAQVLSMSGVDETEVKFGEGYPDESCDNRRMDSPALHGNNKGLDATMVGV